VIKSRDKIERKRKIKDSKKIKIRLLKNNRIQLSKYLEKQSVHLCMNDSAGCALRNWLSLFGIVNIMWPKCYRENSHFTHETFQIVLKNYNKHVIGHTYRRSIHHKEVRGPFVELYYSSNILRTTLLSNTINLCSSINLRDKFQILSKEQIKLYFIIF
jgi:hypothetical protein